MSRVNQGGAGSLGLGCARIGAAFARVAYGMSGAAIRELGVRAMSRACGVGLAAKDRSKSSETCAKG